MKGEAAPFDIRIVRSERRKKTVSARLLDERWKVEIEADAVISTSRDRSATG